MQTIMSLCTGYGGLDLAVETVCDTETRWVSDIDPDAVAVQTVRFPHATQLGDLKQVNWGQYVGQVDVVTAGYPCQPFSAAGQRKGLADERHIWPWIAEAVRVLRPGTVVLENVQGHLRLGFDIVVGDLAAMGRTARWGVVRASDTGAPHRRARLFIVSHLADPDTEGRKRLARCRQTSRCEFVAAHDDNAGWQRFGPAIRRWETIMGRSAPAPLVDGTKQLNARLVEWMMGLPEGWVTDLIPNRRALKTLGNGVVPQQAEMALRMLLT